MKIVKGASAVSLFSTSLFILVSCSGGGGSGGGGGTPVAVPCVGSVSTVLGPGTNPGGILLATPRFAYVSNDDNTIGIYSVETSSGFLFSRGYVLSGKSPGQLVVDPANKFLYSPNTDDNTVSVFSIDATTGAIKEIIGSPFTAGHTPSAAAIDPAGRFLFVANVDGNNISVFQIALGTGGLAPAAGGGPFAAGTAPVGIAIDPSGQFLYVANANSNNLSGFSINGVTGALTPLVGSPFPACATPISIAMDPKGRVLYVANIRSNAISTFVINPATGELTANGVFASSLPSGITMDISGQTIYSVDGLNGELSKYPINQGSGAPAGFPTGVGLTGIPGVVNLATQVLVDPGNTLVYTVNAGINTVAGTLQNSLGDEVIIRTRKTPTSMVFVKGITAVVNSPKFVYAASNLSGSPSTIAGYSILNNGTFSALTGSPFASGASSLNSFAAHPTGPFVYATSSTTNQVFGYDVNHMTGGLSATPSSPYTTGAVPSALVIEPSGRFAYVANSGNGTLSAYSIDLTSGALTALAGSPFGLPPGALGPTMSLQTDPTGQFLFVTMPGAGASGNVATLLINQLTGAVTSSSTVGPTKGSGQVLVKSDGRCVFTTDLATLSNYSLDPLTGALTDGIAQLAAPFPVSAGMDNLGRALYVALGLTVAQAKILTVNLFGATGGCQSTAGNVISLPAPPGALVTNGNVLYVALPDPGGAGAIAGFLTFGASIGNVATGQAFNGPMVMTYSVQ